MSETNVSTERFPHISLLKNICLLGVMVLHVAYPYGTKNPFWQVYAGHVNSFAVYLISFLEPFVIPSFVLASGFLFARSETVGGGAFFPTLLKRSKRLLAPWFLTMVLWLSPTYGFFRVNVYLRPADTSLLDTYKLGFQGLFVDHLWFLLVLFWVTLFWMLVLPLMKKARLHLLWGVVIALAVSFLWEKYAAFLTWYCLWEATPHFVYFYLGYLAFHYRDVLHAFLGRFSIPLFVSLFAVSVLIVSNHSLDPHMSWASSLTASLGAYIFCFAVSRAGAVQKMAVSKTYLLFDRNAFLVYLLHMPTAIVLFQRLDLFRLPAGTAMALTFTGTLAITAVVVTAVRIFQRVIHH